jgi:hypothetical protein
LKSSKESGSAELWIVAIMITAIIGSFLAWWFFGAAMQSKQYEINTHNQQYQAGLIAQERDRAQAWSVATDSGQKELLRSTFCAVYPSLEPAPADLVAANAQMNCF